MGHSRELDVLMSSLQWGCRARLYQFISDESHHTLPFFMLASYFSCIKIKNGEQQLERSIFWLTIEPISFFLGEESSSELRAQCSSVVRCGSGPCYVREIFYLGELGNFVPILFSLKEQALSEFLIDSLLYRKTNCNLFYGPSISSWE